MSPSLEYTTFRGNQEGKIYQSVTKRDALAKDQVLVKITHSGVCYTDVHYKRADISLGHEGAGVVEQVGPDVRGLKVYVTVPRSRSIKDV